MKRVFICVPYTHPDKNVVEQRVYTAQKYFLTLLKNGICPVVPIATGHPIAQAHEVSNSFETWRDYCIAELMSCDEVHALMLDGFNEAKGCHYEIEIANNNNIPVYYIQGETI